jgi:4-amino-4-deoxy-L-arabinose transferase-like glycosyltransferase
MSISFPQKSRLTIVFVVGLTLISFLIRLYNLGGIPNGLTVDEADMGYNAYSILKTEKDVYGRKFPFFFQSLDDYKPGFAIYSLIPAIYLFGNSDFAIRLFSAILGSLTPILIFFVIKSLYPKNQNLAIISAILMVFAPWNIAISRATLMYIELIFFYLIFFLLFLLGIKRGQKYFLSAAVIFGLTLYVYYAAIIYLPLIIAILAIIYHKYFLKNLKTTILSVLILLIISLPALSHYLETQSRSRFNAISVFTPDITLPTSISEMQFDNEIKLSLSSIIHNRRLVYLNATLDNYFDYFNLDYLFVSSKNIRYFYLNNVGLFYFLELPFFLYGLFILFKRREQNDLLVLSLLVIGPIPAMITLGSPFPHRGILLLLAIQLITAVGFANFIDLMKKIRFKYMKHSLAIIVILYTLSVYFFLHQYFVHSPREFTSENDNGAWFSTVRDVIPTVNKVQNNYDNVIFTWSQQKLVPAVYFLFYNQVNPRILQAKATDWTNEPPSFKQIYNQVGNIEFRPINWDSDKNLKNTLLVGYPQEFPKDVTSNINQTYLPNGKLHFLLVKTQ